MTFAGVSSVLWERLISRSIADPLSGCWLWIGARRYGRDGKPRPCIRINRKLRYAYHVAWELVHGRAFPKRKNGCHRCDNTLCVNPDHIRAGTQSSNVRESVARGRGRWRYRKRSDLFIAKGK